MMRAEEFDDISSENETEDNDHIPSDGNGEIDEIVPAFDISDEEAEITKKLLSKSDLEMKTVGLCFISKKKTEKLTYYGKRVGQQGMLIVLRRTLLLHFHFFGDPLLQEICTFTTIEGNLEPKDKWK